MENQVALITGAGRGIGRALAIGFAKAGMDLVLVARSIDQLEDTKLECESFGRAAIAAPADVRNYQQVCRAVKAGIAAFNQIDVLVNNAGYGRLKKIDHMQVEEFQSILNTNVLGVYNCTHAVVPSMLAAGRGGVILNTGSVAAMIPVARMSAYAMSKAALIGFTGSLAEELKGNKISVNTIMPNIVDTPLFREGLTEDQVRRMNPMPPEALVPYFLFFTTQGARKVTGLCLDVDLVKKVLDLTRFLPNGEQSTPSWKTLESLVQEKLPPNEFKVARKYHKLVEYLLALQVP